MPMLEQLPMHLTIFTIVAMLALWVAGILYRQSKSQRLRHTTKKVTGKAGNGGMIGKDYSN